MISPLKILGFCKFRKVSPKYPDGSTEISQYIKVGDRIHCVFEQQRDSLEEVKIKQEGKEVERRLAMVATYVTDISDFEKDKVKTPRHHLPVGRVSLK